MCQAWSSVADAFFHTARFAGTSLDKAHPPGILFEASLLTPTAIATFKQTHCDPGLGTQDWRSTPEVMARLFSSSIRQPSRLSIHTLRHRIGHPVAGAASQKPRLVFQLDTTSFSTFKTPTAILAWATRIGAAP